MDIAGLLAALVAWWTVNGAEVIKDFLALVTALKALYVLALEVIDILKKFGVLVASVRGK